MSNFVGNVKQYLKEMKIKQSYLSLITDMDKNKISRLLSGNQNIKAVDMEKIASALGKPVEFFQADSICLPTIAEVGRKQIAFYAGNPTKEQEILAEKLIDFVENMDEILSTKYHFENFIKRS